MDLFYILTHVEISMAITMIIGILGQIYEPGPVPKLMAIVGAVYLAVYWIAMALFSLKRYENRIKRRKKASSRGCYFYDLKETD